MGGPDVTGPRRKVLAKLCSKGRSTKKDLKVLTSGYSKYSERPSDVFHIFQAQSPRFWPSLVKLVVLLVIYYVPSISITFYQSWLVKRLKFPITIVLSHFIIKFCLAWAWRAVYTFRTGQERVTLGWSQMLGNDGVMANGPPPLCWPKMFSRMGCVVVLAVVTALDIALSQWSFVSVDVDLYTMTKSTSIVFILAFGVVLGLEKKQWSLGVIGVMIFVGLFLFIMKNDVYEPKGFSMVLAASFLSGIRWTVSQLIMQRAKYNLKNPFDMIYHTSPLMIIVCIPFAVGMEGVRVATSDSMFRFPSLPSLLYTLSLVTGGGVIAFLLECAEFFLVGHTSSLTFSLAGIVKEIFTMLLAVSFNDLSPLNVLGLAVCLVGILLHAMMKACFVERKKGGRREGGRKEGRDDASGEALLVWEESDEREEEVYRTNRSSLGSSSPPGELALLPSCSESGATAHTTDTMEMNILKNCEVTNDNVDISEPKDALEEADKLLEQLDLQSSD